MANAVRDNPERAEFVGYDPQRVRYLMLSSRGLLRRHRRRRWAASTSRSSPPRTSARSRSGGVLFMAFIGGVGLFFGPIIGAVLVVVPAVGAVRATPRPGCSTSACSSW